MDSSLIQIKRTDILLSPLSQIYSFTRPTLQLKHGVKWLCTQPNCHRQYYAYLIIVFASLWTWRSLSKIECLNFTLTLDTNERQPSPRTRILTFASEISLFHIQTRKSHSDFNESLDYSFELFHIVSLFKPKSLTFAMDTEGDSCNFDYNWDELSVGNLHINHSNHFFGRIWRKFIHCSSLVGVHCVFDVGSNLFLSSIET